MEINHSTNGVMESRVMEKDKGVGHSLHEHQVKGSTEGHKYYKNGNYNILKMRFLPLEGINVGTVTRARKARRIEHSRQENI